MTREEIQIEFCALLRFPLQFHKLEKSKHATTYYLREDNEDIFSRANLANSHLFETSLSQTSWDDIRVYRKHCSNLFIILLNIKMSPNTSNKNTFVQSWSTQFSPRSKNNTYTKIKERNTSHRKYKSCLTNAWTRWLIRV